MSPLTLQTPFFQLPFLSPQFSVQRTSSRVLEHPEQMVVLAEILTLFHSDGAASLAFAYTEERTEWTEWTEWMKPPILS